MVRLSIQLAMKLDHSSKDIPLNVEQMTVLFTPSERSTIAQAVHNEALRLGLVPSTLSTTATSSSRLETNLEEQLNQFAELRNRKRRRAKYVTRTAKKSFYDVNPSFISTINPSSDHFIDCS